MNREPSLAWLKLYLTFKKYQLVGGMVRSGLVVSALVSGSSGPGSSPGHCVVFWGNTLYCDIASFHPVVVGGRVVRASDLKSVGRGFKSRSCH